MSATIITEITIQNKRGLHLRFAGEIAKIAFRHTACIKISKDGKSADAKSTLSMLTLAAACGTKLTLSTDSETGQEALDEICTFIRNYDSDR